MAAVTVDATVVPPTGGVDDPNRDGIDIDDNEDVEETGDGIAITLANDGGGGGSGRPLVIPAVVVVTVLPAIVTAAVVDDGANKFVIVGECFLFLAVAPVLATFSGVVVPAAGTTGNLEFGDVEAVVDVVVHVDGTFAVAVGANGLPFGIVAGC